MTHAWLIIAHNEFGVLQRLVSMLDCEGNDIYIHFDRKVSELPRISVEHSQLFVLPELDRVDVRWGSVSQIACEMTLLEAAAKNGPYDYYHIISGTTLPLKPMTQIGTFFKRAEGKSVLTGLCQDTPYQETLKVRRYNLFLKNYTAANQVRRRLSQFGWKTAIALQRLLHIETNRDRTFYKASNWLSLSEEAVRYILSQKQRILKTYRWSFCGDEYFIPSELLASPLKERILNSDTYLKREIARDKAATFSLQDYLSLAESDYLFARKFTEQ